MGFSDKNRRKTGTLARTFGALTCATFMTLPVWAQSHPAQAVMDADRAFAARAKVVGAGKAFSEFAETRVLMLNDPVPGTDATELPKLFSPIWRSTGARWTGPCRPTARLATPGARPATTR